MVPVVSTWVNGRESTNLPESVANGKHRNAVKRRGFRAERSVPITGWILPNLPFGAFKSSPPSQTPACQENCDTDQNDPESTWIVVGLIGSTFKIGPQGQQEAPHSHCYRDQSDW